MGNTVQYYLDGVKVKQKENRDEMVKLRKENSEFNKEVEELSKKYEEKIEGMEQSWERIEKEKRKKSLIVTGMGIKTTNKEELKDGIEAFIKDKMEIEPIIRTAYKIGENRFVIKLDIIEQKMRILKNKNTLRDIADGKNVYIDCDLTKNERKIQAEIRKHAKEERKAGKNVNARRPFPYLGTFLAFLYL
ncbi:hypothetical protein FQA39_LY07422 [Lamprigera yunnana]|nr:hypothetical protein FQA39_LY07422 [Lamprigera yunnana]